MVLVGIKLSAESVQTTVGQAQADTNSMHDTRGASHRHNEASNTDLRTGSCIMFCDEAIIAALGRPMQRRGRSSSVMQASSGSAMLLAVSDPPAPPSERWSADLFQQPSGVMVPISPCALDASASTAFWSSPICSQTMILQPEDIMLIPNSPVRDNSPVAAQTDPAYTRLLAKLQRQSAQRRMLYGSAISSPVQRSSHQPADAGCSMDRVATAPLERHPSTSMPPSRLQRGACGTVVMV